MFVGSVVIVGSVVMDWSLLDGVCRLAPLTPSESWALLKSTVLNLQMNEATTATATAAVECIEEVVMSEDGGSCVSVTVSNLAQSAAVREYVADITRTFSLWIHSHQYQRAFRSIMRVWIPVLRANLLCEWCIESREYRLTNAGVDQHRPTVYTFDSKMSLCAFLASYSDCVWSLHVWSLYRDRTAWVAMLGGGLLI